MLRASVTNHSGFTLLEMILATAIFAMLGLASHSVLTSVIDGNQVSKDKLEALQKVQFAFQIMERDFMQASTRRARIDGEAPSEQLMAGGQFIMESSDDAVGFTRDGWRNPKLFLPRSELQFVGYRLFEGQLQRLFYIFVDPVTGSEPKYQPLLDDVEAFKVKYFVDKKWQDAWQKNSLPEAVSLEIKTKELGDITRLFLLPQHANVATSSGIGGIGSSPQSGSRNSNNQQQNSGDGQ